MIKVLCVYGTRPEAIKMAPVVKELVKRSSIFECVQCVTAQHRQMLDQVMQTFDLEADHDLDIMTHAQSPADVTASVLTKLPKVLIDVEPDLLLVQGDTMTTFAAAFAAFLQHIPVGHIEAGLRSGNLDHPFPEEMNRRLTSQLASIHFPPTRGAADALLAEGIDKSTVHVTGNTVIDALFQTLKRQGEPTVPEIASLDAGKRIILVTTHRRENFGDPLINICLAISEITEARPDVVVVWPVHKNPRVKEVVFEKLAGKGNVILIEPLEYQSFVSLMARAWLILSDSGGIQEEAPSLDIPVLVLREVSERPEGIEVGATRLVGTNTGNIVAHTMELLDDPSAYERMANAENPYGDGTASIKIADEIEAYFGKGPER